MSSAVIWPIVMAAFGAPTQQCAPLEGMVYNDLNRDGFYSVGEPGIAGIRLRNADGRNVVTDDNGRFRMNCAGMLTGLESSSVVVELDPDTLPDLYEMTTGTTATVILEAGRTAKAEFGAVLDQVHLTLWEESFEKGQSSLTADSKADLSKVVAMLREGRADVELFYVARHSTATLAADRIRYVEHQLVHRWRNEGCFHEIAINSWAPKRLSARPL